MSQSESPLKENPFDKEDTSDFYSAVDKVYELSAIELVDCLKLDFASKKVYEVGAGTAVSSQVLFNQANCKDLTLVEPSAAMIEQAKSKMGDKVKYLQSSAEDLGKLISTEDKGQVDAIVALNCLHLVQNIADAFIAIYDSLKPGGIFAFNLTAPSYGFENATQKELEILKGNIHFYKTLATKVDNPILAHTAKLLEDQLASNFDNVYTKEKLANFFDKAEFKFEDYQEVLLGFEKEHQKNIWRMMAKSFTQDTEMIEKIIAEIELPNALLIRQAMFKLVKE